MYNISVSNICGGFWYFQFPGTGDAGLAFLMDLCYQYPRMYRFWVGFFHPAIRLQHPDTLRDLMKMTDTRKPTSFGSVYRLGSRWLGDAAEVLLEKVMESTKTGDSFELFSVLGPCSLDIILQCAFSYKSNCQVNSHPYMAAVDEICRLWMKRLMKPHLYLDFIYNLSNDGRKFNKNCDYVHQVADEVINKRKAALAKGGSPTNETNRRYLDFLDILLTARDDDGHGLTALEIRYEVDTFLFAGHDTTTSSMCWALYSLAQHPDIQERVYREIDVIITGRETDDIEWSDLSKLEYLTMCIKESMRLHCPVPVIQRETTKDMVVDGWTLPAGSCVDIVIYTLHHNPAVWEDPFEFRPERFSASSINLIDPFAYIPFSAGPRNCIGQNFAMNEQKVLLARLLHRYRLELVQGHEVTKTMGVVMRAQNGVRVTAHRRYK
ncbi:hypothetical protein ScPMuIL_008172 [Solemya velum]